MKADSKFLKSRTANHGGQKVIPMKTGKDSSKTHRMAKAFPESRHFGVADEQVFNRMLALERKRTERTGDRFVLMLMNLSELADQLDPLRIDAICEGLCSGARDTDVTGWYEYPYTIGIIFTALRSADRKSIQSALLEKTGQTLREFLGDEDVAKVDISFHFFPEEIDGDKQSFKGDEKLYPDLDKKDKSKAGYRIIKRTMDIAGSLFGLLLFSPIFLVVPILIKLTSDGPVFFRQRRIGRFGKEFYFLKFRSMYLNNNPEIHRKYVKSLIEQKEKAAEGMPVFKIVNDPRVTPIGHFLRKTSIDELPQFFNVLKGDMSLVGPRPPIPYEVVEYHYWHRRRIVEVKPGITGLWQVYGRSKTTFDEMVRLDLQYVRDQSILLDLKIIFRTPFAIISGDGAY